MLGHLRRRGTRSFELKFDVASLNGQRRTRYVSFKGTKREAEIELARLIAENAAGRGVDVSKETIAEFITRWDRDWLALNVSPKSLERYRQIIRLYVMPHIGSVRVQKLRPVHLNELYAKLMREGGDKGRELSAGSVGYVHRVLHRALGHAATWGLIGQNPTSLVRPPVQSRRPEINILNEVQIGKLLRHLQGRTLRPIIAFLLGTGARRGEALALRWQDVDLDRGTMRIERSLEQTKSGLRLKAPKTKTGRRSLSISPSLVSELRAHRARQRKDRLLLGLGRAPEDSPVFARFDGEMRSPHWLSQKFAQAAAELGFDCTLHSLRHAHASALIAAGVDVLTVSRRLGHASPSITLEVYGHLYCNTDLRAAEVMEATLAKARTE